MSDSEESGLPRLHHDRDADSVSPDAKTSYYQPAELLSADEPADPHFVVVRGSRTLGTIHKLQTGQVVGRALSADIQLAEPGVSRRHAKVTLLPGHRVLIEDLESSNGMFAAGERVDRKIMAPGDSIQLGNARLALLLMDDAERGRRRRDTDETHLPSSPQLVAHFGDALDYAKRFDGHAAICAIAADEVDAVFAAHGSAGVAVSLRRIAQVIADVVGRDEVLVGRVGFGTLGLSLPDADLESALRSAEWIRRVVSNTRIDIFGDPWKLTLTVGVAASSESGPRAASEMLALSRRRLHAAASRGGNGVEPVTVRTEEGEVGS